MSAIESGIFIENLDDFITEVMLYTTLNKDPFS